MYSISILHFTYLGVHTHPLPPGLAALLNELTYCIVVSSTVALVGSLMSSSGHNQSQQAYTKFNNEGTKNLMRMHGFFAHYSGTAGTRLTLKCTRGVPCALRKVAGAFWNETTRCSLTAGVICFTPSTLYVKWKCVYCRVKCGFWNEWADAYKTTTC